ncbi:hypothetical protein ACFQ36_08560 [Arthrobacter sp. GCM10027362]|uniref:hypothetical protein n=1 Tax=Arthrobacter sp. GCM10027362 TaxID=3273379 RepID=UPI0036289A5B
MENESTELGIYVEGDAAMIVGNDDDIELFMRHISDGSPVKAKAMTKDALTAVAGVSGLASQAQLASGKWVQLTTESATRLKQLAATNPSKDGIIAGVVRGPKGRIDQHLKLILPGGAPNALMTSNAATMAMSMAIQMAVEDLRQYLKAMDVKLDKLLKNDRSEVMGDIRGVTRTLSEAFDMYQETGRVSSVNWDKVQQHPTALASFVAQCVEQIESMTEEISRGSVSDKAKAVEQLAREELSFWLSILAVSLANQRRFHVLELARVNQEHPEDAAIHREVIGKHNEAMARNVSRALQRLNEALQSAGKVKDLERVVQPIPARDLVRAVNRAHGQLGRFVNMAKLGTLSWTDSSQKDWGKAVADVAQQGGAAVGGAVNGVFGGIRNLAEQAVLIQAKRIEAERAARDQGGEPGKDIDVVDPDRPS